MLIGVADNMGTCQKDNIALDDVVNMKTASRSILADAKRLA